MQILKSTALCQAEKKKFLTSFSLLLVHCGLYYTRMILQIWDTRQFDILVGLDKYNACIVHTFSSDSLQDYKYPP